MVGSRAIRGAGAAAAGLALLATCTLAACGTRREPAPGTGHTGPAGQRRAAATRYARQLLGDLRLPAGRRLPWPATLPRAARPMLPAEMKTVVDLRELYHTPGGIAAVNGYLTVHVPHGLVVGTAGNAGNVRLPSATAYYVDYNPRHLPHGVYDATLGIAVVPARGGGSLVRVDAQVAWYPSRSAAEHIDQRRYLAVTVTAPRDHGSAPLVTRTFTARRVIARLTALVNALPAMPAFTGSCPAMAYGSYDRLTFRPATTRWPRIVVTMPGCGGAGVRVGAHAEPALDYLGSPLIATMDRLLGLHPSASRR